jgi:putative oxygen-independent coproporphyrinogen III oxidase
MVKAAYIHIPFCEHICHYCDFNKVFLKGQPVDEYLDALEEEIRLTLDKQPAEPLKSVFVGGGTPTSLSEKQLHRLLTSIYKYLPLDPNVEFTFEANPGDLSDEKFRVLHEGGVNRLSFGVQTFDNELLKAIGRTHRAEDVFKSIEKAKTIGFKNISVDLIYSLPNQTLDSFKETLDTALSLDLQHFSGYSLIIEPKTVFYNLMRKGKLPVPGEDTEAEMYSILMEHMELSGYRQYEISNFALPGYESKHNLTYWNNEEYYGFGAGSHSYVAGERIANHGPLKKYMDQIWNGHLPSHNIHKVENNEKWEEEMFLGLRKMEGISIEHFVKKFGVDPLALFKDEIHSLQHRDLITVQNGKITLTQKGRFLGNEVFQSFIGVI